jgi:hypothetical protein
MGGNLRVQTPINPVHVAAMKALYDQGVTFRNIGPALAAQGILNDKGEPYTSGSVSGVISRRYRQAQCRCTKTEPGWLQYVADKACLPLRALPALVPGVTHYMVAGWCRWGVPEQWLPRVAEALGVAVPGTHAPMTGDEVRALMAGCHVKAAGLARYIGVHPRTVIGWRTRGVSSWQAYRIRLALEQMRMPGLIDGGPIPIRQALSLLGLQTDGASVNLGEVLAIVRLVNRSKAHEENEDSVD